VAVQQRARQDWQKEERRQAIIDAARQLFIENDGQLTSVAAVAERAGLAKGTTYLYFQSKEEIFLAVLEDRIRRFADAIVERLGAVTAPGTIEDVVDAICVPLFDDPTVLQLDSYSYAVLEQNIDAETAQKFDDGLLAIVTGLARAVHERLPDVSLEVSAQLVLRSYAFSLGMWQATTGPADTEDTQPTALRPDFKTELREGLTALWRGTLGTAG